MVLAKNCALLNLRRVPLDVNAIYGGAALSNLIAVVHTANFSVRYHIQLVPQNPGVEADLTWRVLAKRLGSVHT